MKMSCSLPMKLELDPVVPSQETPILSKLTKAHCRGFFRAFIDLLSPFFRLYFQCKYWAANFAALVIQPLVNADPLPLVASGPLQVELRLGKGQCVTKGCVQGEGLSNIHVQPELVSSYNRKCFPVSQQNK